MSQLRVVSRVDIILSPQKKFLVIFASHLDPWSPSNFQILATSPHSSGLVRLQQKRPTWPRKAAHPGKTTFTSFLFRLVLVSAKVFEDYWAMKLPGSKIGPTWNVLCFLCMYASLYRKCFVASRKHGHAKFERLYSISLNRSRVLCRSG